jgi:hypothetical protein
MVTSQIVPTPSGSRLADSTLMLNHLRCVINMPRIHRPS